MRTTGLNDGIWVNVRDVPICFGGRTYGTDDRFVVEVDGVRYAIEAAGSVRRVRSRPDLVAEPSAMGALLLGGVLADAARPRTTAHGAHRRGLRRAEHFFTIADRSAVADRILIGADLRMSRCRS